MKKLTNSPTAADRNKDEANFNLSRIRQSLQSGHKAVPAGLSTEQLIEWMCGRSQENVADR
ncbi:hypothetical protein N7333_02320 [Pseudomonas sp. GD04158]|uniref:hypothetical protein n=1 Tax=Pseudomonas sp. GD04158 TaxID=2975439 RepID=UPI00244CE675|nr:hypothetical protein [Pseudomonas sp. GD04158]MDH0095413.1 hypothetical protein [Pseudomonas sp. GD04158]